jgi:hypothetical protein
MALPGKQYQVHVRILPDPVTNLANLGGQGLVDPVIASRTAQGNHGQWTGADKR